LLLRLTVAVVLAVLHCSAAICYAWFVVVGVLVVCGADVAQNWK
jgi:hypothetical protein